MFGEQQGLEALNRALFTYTIERVSALKAGDRFVHYTTADAALEIIGGDADGKRSLWLRSAEHMNDFSEIEWGQYCLEDAISDRPLRERFARILDSFGNNLSEQLFSVLADQKASFKTNTYLLSLALHGRNRSRTGLLSMWRAYGGAANVCLVFHTRPFATYQTAYELSLSPVMYGGPAEFRKQFESVVFRLEREALAIRQLQPDAILNGVKRALEFAVNSTKHPGFSEEREWRVIFHGGGFRPEPPSRMIDFRGTRQIIYEIPLTNRPDHHLLGAEIPEALDHLVIGPTDEPETLREQFIEVLRRVGFSAPENRVISCDIPLRRN